MIRNKAEREHTQQWIKKFEDALVELEASAAKPDAHWSVKVQRDALRSQLDDLKRDLAAYDRKPRA